MLPGLSQPETLTQESLQLEVLPALHQTTAENPPRSRQEPSIKWIPKPPNRFQLPESHTSSGKRTVTLSAKSRFSTKVLVTNPGPVVFKIMKSVFEKMGNPRIMGFSQAESFCALTQLSIMAARNG